MIGRFTLLASAVSQFLIFPAFAATDPHRIDIWTYFGPTAHFNQVVFQSIEKRHQDNPYYNTYVAGVTHEKHGFQFLPNAGKGPDFYLCRNPILELESAYRNVSCSKFLEIRHDFPFKDRFLKNYMDYEHFLKEKKAGTLSSEQFSLVEYYEGDPNHRDNESFSFSRWWTKGLQKSSEQVPNNSDSHSSLWIVSGQTTRGGLQLRRLPLELTNTLFPDTNLNRNQFKYVWEIDQAIQSTPDKIPEILSAATTLMTIQLRQSKGDPSQAFVFAHSRSEPQTRDFKSSYGMQLYRRSTVNPGESILYAPLSALLDRFMSRSPFKLLNQLQDFSTDVSKNIGLICDLSDLKSTYLDVRSDVDTQPNSVVQIRDFTNSFELVKKSVLSENGFGTTNRLKTTDLDRFLFEYAYELRDARIQLKSAPENRNTIKPLYRFLRDENAIEVIAADNVKPVAILIGAFYFYLSRLNQLGIESPEQWVKSQDIKIAMTTFSPSQAAQLRELGPSNIRTYAKPSSEGIHSKYWVSVGEPGEAKNSKVFVGTYVFTMDQIQELITGNSDLSEYKGVLFEGPLHDEYRISHGGWFNL